jgi:hypothetical protein
MSLAGWIQIALLIAVVAALRRDAARPGRAYLNLRPDGRSSARGLVDIRRDANGQHQRKLFAHGPQGFADVARFV